MSVIDDDHERAITMMIVLMMTIMAWGKQDIHRLWY